MEYATLAYYHFISLDDPHEDVKKHKKFFENRDATGRIYLSEEGINGQLSGEISEMEAYMAWLKEDPRFKELVFKIDQIPENIFPRMTIKYRRQLVALDLKVDITNGGEHVSPKKWKEMLETKEYLVLDVRNAYEWEIGHFEGAEAPPLKTFRQFPEYAEQLKQKYDPKKTKVMMYCTGGIRCELYSALLKKKGFDKVYQLEGGVINYGQKEGSEHWRGKLFVFDDRLAVSIDGEESEPISQCIHCGLSCDTYYNCANMECNELFICCPSCLEVYRGCCSYTCTQEPRIRPIDPKEGNKPFRRKHLLSCALPTPKSDSESHS